MMLSLTNHDIIRYARKAHIPYFRNVYMKYYLPKSGVLECECGVVNLNKSSGKGTHWVCYYKNQVYICGCGYLHLWIALSTFVNVDIYICG